MQLYKTCERITKEAKGTHIAFIKIYSIKKVKNIQMHVFFFI